MHPLDDLLRALAPHLATLCPADITDARARALIFEVAHHGCCPQCGAEALATTRIACPSCGKSSSLTAGTPLHGRKLSLRHWCLAAFHILVATETTNACAFSRAYALRRPTAWALLHRARDAIPYERPTRRGATTMLTGRVNPANTVHVAVNIDERGLTCAPVEDTPPVLDLPSPLSSVWLGHLRAWVSAHFKMISRNHVCAYLREFAFRFSRVMRSAGAP